MKIKSALATQASGSIGGLTATRDRGRIVLRGRSIPTDPNTPEQQAVRETFGVLTAAWSQTLTPTQQATWAIYGQAVPAVDPLGTPVTLSGQQAFMRANLARNRAGGGYVTEAPSILSAASPISPIMLTSVDASTVQIAWQDSEPNPGKMYVYVGRPQPPTTNFFRGPYQFAAAVGLALGPLSVDLPTFGYQGGQRMFVRTVVVLDDGRVSQESQAFLDLP